METYYFYCECPNCLDESADLLKSSLKCPHCERGCVPILTECCVNCHNDISQTNPHSSEKRGLRSTERFKICYILCIRKPM